MRTVLVRAGAYLLSSLLAIPAALWIVRREKLIQRRGRPLRPEEFNFARDLGIRDLAAIRIHSLPTVPAPLGGVLTPLENLVGFSLSGAAGVTLGHGICIAERCESFALIFHELVHVHQYERLGGPLPFIHRYFYECMVFGYHDSPLEREAVKLSGA